MRFAKNQEDVQGAGLAAHQEAAQNKEIAQIILCARSLDNVQDAGLMVS